MKDRAQPPNIDQIGRDLLNLSVAQIILALALPFFFCVAYFYCFEQGHYALSLGMLVALSYFTYGSVSHDLVHQAYHLPKTLNRSMLSLIELLCLRSGTAYRMAHLNHHRIFPSHGDVEGRAATFNWRDALIYGILFQPLIWRYAFQHANERQRRALLLEAFVISSILTIALALRNSYPELILYCIIIHIGGWIIPFVTSYIPHRAEEKRELDQTRRFRGVVSSILTLEHLYHLEHHLYPRVPHQNWARLAKRLDDYLDREGAPRIKIFW